MKRPVQRMPSVRQLIIVRFVAVLRVLVAIPLQNAGKMRCVHTTPSALQTWHADMVNALIHVLPNAATQADATS